MMLNNTIQNNADKSVRKKITRHVKIFLFVLILLLILFGTHSLKKNSFTCNPDKNKVVVVLVDGADWRIIDHLIEKDRLPTFKKLVNTGSSGILFSIASHTSPNNISMFTGVLPSKHGITSHFYFDEEARKLKQSSISQLKANPIWKTLEEKYCFAVLSFSEIPIAFKINNVSVSALYIIKEIQQYSNLEVVGKGFLKVLDITNKLVYPGNLLNKFDLTFLKETKTEMESMGMYIKFNSSISERMSNNVISALKNVGSAKKENDILIDGIDKFFKSENSAKFIYDIDALTKNIAVNLLENKMSNVYFMSFFGTDTLGHMYYMDGWHIEDKNDSQEQIFKYYEVMDSYLSELIEAAGENSTFIVLSDHGMQDIPFSDYELSIQNFGNKSSKYYARRLNPPHTAEAIFIANGPNIAHESGIYGEMMDIVPTIYCILNTPFNKSDYDGEILGNIFTEEYKDSSGCEVDESDMRGKFLDWNKNNPDQFLNLNQEDRDFLHSVVTAAILDYSRGVRPHYLWKRYTFSRNIIFVTLQSEGFNANSYWISRENIAQGVYDSTYAILENLNIGEKDLQYTINPTIRILYNQDRVDDNFILGEDPIGIIEKSGGYIYTDTSSFKEKSYSMEKVFEVLCSKRNLDSGCSSSQQIYTWDIVEI